MKFSKIFKITSEIHQITHFFPPHANNLQYFINKGAYHRTIGEQALLHRVFMIMSMALMQQIGNFMLKLLH